MAEGLKALPATYRFTHNQSGRYSPKLRVTRLLIPATCTQTWTLRARGGIFFLSTMDARLEFTPRMSTWLAWGPFGGMSEPSCPMWLAKLTIYRRTELCLVVV